MGDWVLDCDCCGRRIKKIRNVEWGYDTYNLDDTPHEKHYKAWASAIASFANYDNAFIKLDPKSKVGDLTIEDLEKHIEFKLNLKFGQYYHGQSEFREKWLTPKKFNYNGKDYFIAGNVDGIIDNQIIEMKTTWATTKPTIQKVIERAQTQANIYSWMSGIQEAKIIIKCLAKPEYDTTVNYKPDISEIENLIITYIDENQKDIKKY